MAKKINNKYSRRLFFKKSGGIVASAVVAGSVLPTLASEKSNSLDSSFLHDVNDITRMTHDLQVAMQKPIEERKWAMVVDARKCIACDACTVACIAENNLPPNITYRKVLEVEDGEFPNVQRFFKPTNCMQCEKPTCVEAANAVVPGSMAIRQDRIVTIDYTKMKGKEVFEAAKKACPYEHALYFDEGGNYTDNTPSVQKYESFCSKEYGKEFKRSETINTTRKCHFCLNKIESGLLPACVTTCVGRAMYFGDLNNSGSLIATHLKNNQSFVINEGAKTAPAVKFIHDKLDETCLKCHG